MTTFGRKGLKPKPDGPKLKLVTGMPANDGLSIIVRQASVQPGLDAASLAYEVVQFVNHALQRCGFERDELPQAAMWAFHVDYYIAQVNNGGHGQFAHNSGWHDFIIDDIRSGLNAIGHREAIEVFDQFLTFSKAAPDRFDGVAERAGFGDEDSFVERLDQRFYAGIGDQLREGLGGWISEMPQLEALPDAQYREAMSALSTRNPMREQRLQEREANRRRQQQEDPAHQLLNYICRVTPGDITFESCLSANPQGEAGGVIFRVATSAGVGDIFVMPEGKGGLLMAGEKSPRSKIPLAMIDGYLCREGFDPISPQIAPGRQ